MKNKIAFGFAVFFLAAGLTFSQEAVGSTEEDYFDFLHLNGIVSKESLFYRTLSDSRWSFCNLDSADFSFPWSLENVSSPFFIADFTGENENWFLRGISKKVSAKIYGPEYFSSYNSRAPYGQNDGALWQGRGYNASFTTGARLEAFGFELTFKPQISFSQNKDFEIMTPRSTAHGEYSHYGSYGIDAPQRFGDSSFWNFDWGDCEIRWNFHSFTAGFGTQSVWTGPSSQNSILLSNNAASFPKLDFGLRKTKVILPFLNWDLGDIEARLFYGKLTESDYFDSNPENDENMLSCITFSYSPSFLEGFTVGFTKLCFSKWGEQVSKYLNPFFSGNTIKNYTGEDQAASLSADWVFPKVGLEIYGEIGVDDFLRNGLYFYEYARYPFHTMIYTVGLKKSIQISEPKKIHGVISFEWSNFEPSQDYQMWAGSNYNFGSHSQIIQGKTNRGQYLGSGIGYGGNSQILSFKVYSPHGYDKFIIGRNNPDNGFIFNKFVDQTPSNSENPNLGYENYSAFKANFFVGAESMWFITKKFSCTGGFLYNLIINPHFDNAVYREDYVYWNNFRFTLKLKHQIM